MVTGHLCVCLYPQKESEEAVQIQNIEAIRVISSLLQVKILSAIMYITNRSVCFNVHQKCIRMGGLSKSV